MPLLISHRDGGAVLSVKVVPGASRDKIVGEYDGALKIAVSKPAQRGAANKAVIALLAKTLGIPQRNIQIVHGHRNARKDVRIVGIELGVVSQRLA